MEQARHRTGFAARRAEVSRAALAVARFALRAALVTLPLLAFRALCWPRDLRASDLSDRHLADIGLTRADVTRPHERPGPAEFEIQRMLRGRDRR